MRGLRTQETDKFNRFFSLIQAEAKKQSAVFFADAGDGNGFETPTLEGEDMMGWLIPEAKVPEFEPAWENDSVDDAWTDFFVWATWKINGDSVQIQFVD